MQYAYSPSENLFYNPEYYDTYIDNGLWPDDVVMVDESVFSEYSGVPPEGKIRAASNSGLPVWVDTLPPTQEELVRMAEEEKSNLLLEAKSIVSLWQTELQLGIISDEDKASLIAWLSYIKDVQAVDTSTAPNIKWPERL